MSIFRKKTKTSLEDELKKTGDLYNSVMNTVDRVEKMIEKFKGEGRTNDAIFAAKIATVWRSNGDYLRFCILELKKSIETGRADKSCRLSVVVRVTIRLRPPQLSATIHPSASCTPVTPPTLLRVYLDGPLSKVNKKC